jgi:hypothetical protein
VVRRFLQNIVALFETFFEFLLLLSNALRYSLFVQRARRGRSVFNPAEPRPIAAGAKVLANIVWRTFCAKWTLTFHNDGSASDRFWRKAVVDIRVSQVSTSHP